MIFRNVQCAASILFRVFLILWHGGVRHAVSWAKLWCGHQLISLPVISFLLLNVYQH